jgi:exodeoxyribonuclease VIII
MQFAPNTEGIFFDLPDDVYRKAPGVSQTELKWMRPTPAHYRAKKDAPPEPPTDAQVIGKLTHSAVLERKIEGQFTIKPDGMTFASKDGKAWRDAQTLPIVSQEVADNIAGMTDSVACHPTAQAVLKNSRREVSGFKRDPETGLMLKARADVLTTDANGLTVIPDLKTCDRGEADSKEFSRAIWKWGYHLQAAHYLDVFGASSFLFIVVEKLPPYAVAIYYLSAEALNKGRADRDLLLAELKRCQDESLWPGYTELIQEISLPNYKN